MQEIKDPFIHGTLLRTERRLIMKHNTHSTLTQLLPAFLLITLLSIGMAAPGPVLASEEAEPKASISEEAEANTGSPRRPKQTPAPPRIPKQTPAPPKIRLSRSPSPPRKKLTTT